MAMDYREYILDHYRDPRNYGELEHPDVHCEDFNPLCGDQLAMDLQVESDRVTAATVTRPREQRAPRQSSLTRTPVRPSDRSSIAET